MFRTSNFWCKRIGGWQFSRKFRWLRTQWQSRESRIFCLEKACLYLHRSLRISFGLFTTRMLFCVRCIVSYHACNFWGHVRRSAFWNWYTNIRLAWHFRRFEDISWWVLAAERKLLLDAELVLHFIFPIERRWLSWNLLLPPFIDCTGKLCIYLPSWSSKGDCGLVNSICGVWRIKFSCLRWFLEDNNLFSLSICYISRLINEGFPTFESWFKIHFILINY